MSTTFALSAGLSLTLTAHMVLATSVHQVLADFWLSLWSKQESAPGANLAPNAAPIIDSATKRALLLSPKPERAASAVQTTAFIFSALDSLLSGCHATAGGGWLSLPRRAIA
jgi:hypothetical protein